MGEKFISFKKFKKKAQINTLIKSLIISLSAGSLAFSIPYLIVKLNKIEFKTLYLGLIGVGTFLILFGLLYLILKPSDRQIAIRLDNEFCLQEKVQTMIEFQDNDSYIAKLQREDTDSLLSKISIKKLSIKFLTILLIVMGLAVSFCITAVAIPKPEEQTEPPIIDPDYELDDWTAISIKDLIKYVKESNINEKLKTKHVADLESLLVDLEDSTKESQMKEIVLGVIDNMTLQLDIINTNNEIYEVLKSAVGFTTLASNINALDIDAIGNSIDIFITLINGEVDAIEVFNNNFGRTLKESNLNKEDECYKALVELNDKIYQCREEANVYSAVTNVVYAEKVNILAAFSKQIENKEVTEYVINELNELFGLKENEGDEGKDPSRGDETEEPVDPELPPIDQDFTGGYGTGEIIFGSNDSMFDPEAGKIIFSDVISQYQNDINDRLEEGKIPEYLKEYFEYYYDILFGTIDNQE